MADLCNTCSDWSTVKNCYPTIWRDVSRVILPTFVGNCEHAALFVLYCDRLTDDTFTLDEVKEMLDSLLTVVRSEVDNELNHTAHTNILLLVQLFQQAEKWHLKLQADISELENRSVKNNRHFSLSRDQ